MRSLRTGLSLAAAPLLVALIYLAGTTAATQTKIAAPEEARPDVTAYSLTEVSPSVVVARHEFGSNLTCIALDDGLVFVDTGLSTRLARRFREEMEKRFARPTQALIITHAHMDHLLAMGAFSDVPVVTAEVKRPFFERLASVEWTEQRIEAFASVFAGFREVIGDATPFVPTAFFADEHAIGTVGRGLVIKRVGGHSACSSYVFYAPEGVLVSGDLVQSDRRPYFGEADTDLHTWIAALKAWHGMEVAKVCPGHGPVVDRDYLPGIWGYFDELEATVAKLKAEGLSIEEIAVHSSLPIGYWGGGDSLPRWWGACIAVVYGSV